MIPAAALAPRASFPGAIQRMEQKADSEIRLKPLQSEYAQYYGIICRYNQSNSYVKDNSVEYWLQVGQALGLRPPHTDNHAGQVGGGGEGEKTKEEQENFKRWKTANQVSLNSARVQDKKPSKSSSLVHSEAKQEEVKREKERKEMLRRKEKKSDYCEENGHNYQWGYCLNCGNEQ